YRPGEEEERLPIHLLTQSGHIKELSRQSDIVDAISGKRRTDHKLYFPMDLIVDMSEKAEEKKAIMKLLGLG
ncbi:hypothetical protein JEM65_21370, partial [Gelidibacter salicanalis]|nr:hypothetical protein [Gelidibacter salicanalis]